jgi:hypothetical protein
MDMSPKRRVSDLRSHFRHKKVFTRLGALRDIHSFAGPPSSPFGTGPFGYSVHSFADFGAAIRRFRCGYSPVSVRPSGPAHLSPRPRHPPSRTAPPSPAPPARPETPKLGQRAAISQRAGARAARPAPDGMATCLLALLCSESPSAQSKATPTEGPGWPAGRTACGGGRPSGRAIGAGASRMGGRRMRAADQDPTKRRRRSGADGKGVGPATQVSR